MEFLNCYICNHQINPKNGVRMRAKTKYSETGVHELIQGFLKDTHLLRFSANDIVCDKCYEKLNHYDLACRVAEEIQEQITNALHATEQIFLSEETVEYLADEPNEESIYQNEFNDIRKNYEQILKKESTELHFESQFEDNSKINMTIEEEGALNDEESINENKLPTDDKKTNTSRRKTVCSKCKISFNTKREFKKHELRYHTVKKCGICQKICDSQMKLREHTRQDHEIENDSTDDVTDDPKSPEIVYRCDFCNATESSVTALDHHVALHENQFKCVVCNKVLKHKGNLVLHMRIHTDKKFFYCVKCGKTFVHKSSLRMHLQTTHTNVRNKECPECPLKFKTTSQLNQHMVTHTGIKKHACPECGKAFGQRYNMTAHYRSHHATAKQLGSETKLKVI